jgi:hypothetical protein
MPTFRITAPDGTKYNVTGPDGSTPEQALAQVQAQHDAPAAPVHVNSPAMTAKIDGDQISQDAKAGPSYLRELAGSAGDLLAGGIRGAGSIGATIVNAAQKVNSATTSDAQRKIIDGAAYEPRPSDGPTLSSLVTGNAPVSQDEQRRQDMDNALRSLGADTSSPAFKVGKLGTEIAGTAGVGGAIAGTLRAAPVVAATAPNLLRAVQTGGMTAGAGGSAVGNALTRVAGGAINGGASAGLVEPSQAGTGAVVGAALPIAGQVVGAAGNAMGKLAQAPAQSPEAAAAIQAARDAGYVIPPTQANPTLLNRALEGFSGKLTTAQNASARNQAVTNASAAKAVGLPEGAQITTEALDAVRAEAGKAYGAVAKLGPLDTAGAKLPDGVAVKYFTDPLTLAPRSTVDSAELVRAWKQSNADATAYYRAYARDANPETLAKAKAAASDAKSVDDFLTKALTTPAAASGKSGEQLIAELSKGYISPADFIRQSVAKPAEGDAVAFGNQALLDALKAARVRIAKTYSVEAALNPATGTVDAGILAKQLRKGKVLTDGLKDSADFAARFPKAAQTPERMGSLPGSSPLDFAAAGGLSAATGNPLMMASVLARPIARAATLSPLVQNRLVQAQGPNALQALIAANPNLALLGYRAAPTTLADR